LESNSSTSVAHKRNAYPEVSVLKCLVCQRSERSKREAREVREKCELCGIGIRLRACCVLRLVSVSCVFNAVCLLHCDVACGMWHSLYCDWDQSKATIDFLGLSQVKLNLKNALKFYCIPISLSSFIIMCILLAVMLTPCLSFSLAILSSLSLSRSLSFSF